MVLITMNDSICTVCGTCCVYNGCVHCVLDWLCGGVT